MPFVPGPVCRLNCFLCCAPACVQKHDQLRLYWVNEKRPEIPESMSYSMPEGIKDLFRFVHPFRDSSLPAPGPSPDPAALTTLCPVGE